MRKSIRVLIAVILVNLFLWQPSLVIAARLNQDAGSNRMLSITDIWNQKTKFNYDQFGNVLSTVYLEGTPDALTSSATYTAFDNVATTTDALQRTVNYTYNDKGLLTRTRDWLGQETAFTYNPKGQVLTATDNTQRTSKFTYDKGNPVESEDPMGRKVRQFVDAAGRATRIYDPLGGVEYFGEDGQSVRHHRGQRFA